MDLDEVAVFILFSKCVQVDDTNCGGDEPRQAQHTTDKVEDAIQHNIVVIRLSVLKLVVAFVVDKMPSDTIVKVEQHESQDRRSSSDKWEPALAVEVGEIDEPGTRANSRQLIWVVVRERGGTRRIAASEGRFELVGYLQAFRLNVAKDELVDQRPNNNRRRDSKVANRGPDAIVTKESRVLETSEEEDQGASANAKDDTQDTCSQEVVVFVAFVILVRLLIGVQVVQETNIRKGIANSIHYEDAHNE